MENKSRRRGRPRIDADFTECISSSRRVQLNAKYMYDGVEFISEASDEIPGHDILWHADTVALTAGGKNGILEQLGRMLEQDHISRMDCIEITNLAIDALNAGSHSREVENAMRAIRMAFKEVFADPENKNAMYNLGKAVNALRQMGGKTEFR